MKLKECTIGTLVYTEDRKIGHIVGLTYNLSNQTIFKSCILEDELFERVIPLVKFVGDEIPRGIHYSNIQKVSW